MNRREVILGMTAVSVIQFIPAMPPAFAYHGFSQEFKTYIAQPNEVVRFRIFHPKMTKPQFFMPPEFYVQAESYEEVLRELSKIHKKTVDAVTGIYPPERNKDFNVVCTVREGVYNLGDRHAAIFSLTGQFCKAEYQPLIDNHLAGPDVRESARKRPADYAGSCSLDIDRVVRDLA